MVSDAHLQKAVLAELAWEPSVIAAHIGVSAADGVVTLSGHVGTYAGKLAAAEAASRVRDVTAVAQELEVRLPADARREDDAIASAIVQRLAWDVSVPRHAIKVVVEHGWVTLTGEVDWFYQKEEAARAVRPMVGVVGISNDATVRNRIDTADIGYDIAHALHRSWYFDPQTVSVSAAGGTVTLEGTVHSPHERDVAGEAAWAAPGTTGVRNNLRVVA